MSFHVWISFYKFDLLYVGFNICLKEKIRLGLLYLAFIFGNFKLHRPKSQMDFTKNI